MKGQGRVDRAARTDQARVCGFILERQEEGQREERGAGGGGGVVHEDQRCWGGRQGAGGRRDSQLTPLGTETHPALRLLVCLQRKPQLHHPLQKVPNSPVLRYQASPMLF